MSRVPPLRQLQRPNTTGAGFYARESSESDSLGSNKVAHQVADPDSLGSDKVAHQVADQAPLSSTVTVQQTQLGSPLSSELGSHKVAISKQEHVDLLRGKEREALLFFFDECRVAGGLVTNAITIELIAHHLVVTKNRARNVINRLQMKGLITRAGGIRGNGGWSKYQLPNTVFQKLMLVAEMRHKVANRYPLSSTKVADQVADEVADGLRRRSNINNLTSSSVIDPAWNEIDIEPLADIRFTRDHVVQVARKGMMNPEMFQNSVNHFAFDLLRNNKGKNISSPLGYFMGAILKGMPYAAPANYESPQMEAIRIYHEGQMAQAVQLEALERKIINAKFEAWERALSPTERERLSPVSPKGGGLAQRAELHNHFCEFVFPNLE
jgi:hypothetical protein